MKKKLVILSGAGMSAESGIQTFRDADGLWEGYDVMEVASPEGWKKNQALVLDFYNQRRKNVLDAKPNQGHIGIAQLESEFDVQIITQNVDDLHERAGSSNVLHLHGELLKVRSSANPNEVMEWRKDLSKGDVCKLGAQLRPHIVWFGEMVPALEAAIPMCMQADYLVVIGTSLLVYPAASLIHYTQQNIPKFIIDPNIPSGIPSDYIKIDKGASEGVVHLKSILEV